MAGKARKPRISNSRPARWQRAVAKAQEGLSLLQEGMSELSELRDEYQDWMDNLPENLQGSAIYDKLTEVTNLDFDSGVDDLDNLIGEAEAIDLPQGFGRD